MQVLAIAVACTLCAFGAIFLFLKLKIPRRPLAKIQKTINDPQIQQGNKSTLRLQSFVFFHTAFQTLSPLELTVILPQLRDLLSKNSRYARTTLSLAERQLLLTELFSTAPLTKIIWIHENLFPDLKVPLSLYFPDNWNLDPLLKGAPTGNLAEYEERTLQQVTNPYMHAHFWSPHPDKSALYRAAFFLSHHTNSQLFDIMLSAFSPTTKDLLSEKDLEALNTQLDRAVQYSPDKLGSLNSTITLLGSSSQEDRICQLISHWISRTNPSPKDFLELFKQGISSRQSWTSLSLKLLRDLRDGSNLAQNKDMILVEILTEACKSNFFDLFTQVLDERPQYTLGKESLPILIPLIHHAPKDLLLRFLTPSDKIRDYSQTISNLIRLCSQTHKTAEVLEKYEISLRFLLLENPQPDSILRLLACTANLSQSISHTLLLEVKDTPALLVYALRTPYCRLWTMSLAMLARKIYDISDFITSRETIATCLLFLAKHCETNHQDLREYIPLSQHVMGLYTLPATKKFWIKDKKVYCRDEVQKKLVAHMGCPSASPFLRQVLKAICEAISNPEQKVGSSMAIAIACEVNYGESSQPMLAYATPILYSTQTENPGPQPSAPLLTDSTEKCSW